MREDIYLNLTPAQRFTWRALGVAIAIVYIPYFMLVMVLSLPMYPWIFLNGVPEWLETIAGEPVMLLVNARDKHYRKKALENKERRKRTI